MSPCFYRSRPCCNAPCCFQHNISQLSQAEHSVASQQPHAKGNVVACYVNGDAEVLQPSAWPSPLLAHPSWCTELLHVVFVNQLSPESQKKGGLKLIFVSFLRKWGSEHVDGKIKKLPGEGMKQRFCIERPLLEMPLAGCPLQPAAGGAPLDRIPNLFWLGGMSQVKATAAPFALKYR